MIAKKRWPTRGTQPDIVRAVLMRGGIRTLDHFPAEPRSIRYNLVKTIHKLRQHGYRITTHKKYCGNCAGFELTHMPDGRPLAEALEGIPTQGKLFEQSRRVHHARFLPSEPKCFDHCA